MAILKDKKVVIIGDRDGIPGPAIAECVKTDVYKRQRPGRVGPWNQLQYSDYCRPPSHMHVLTGRNPLHPVSYTHLDVYKRQLLCQSCQMLQYLSAKRNDFCRCRWRFGRGGHEAGGNLPRPGQLFSG